MLLPKAKKNTKITTPRMGTLQLMLEDLFQRLDTEYIEPPNITARTLELGVRHSPEFACLPLKVCIGSFIEAIEAGADTIVMAGGCGPCRFGYYAQVQKEVLSSIGHDVNWIILEPVRLGLLSFVRTFHRMAPHKTVPYIWKQVKISFEKARAYDSLERRLTENRAFELTRGDSDKAYREGVDILRSAWTREEIAEAAEAAVAHMDKVPMDKSRTVLKIGIAGEFYMLLEPSINFSVEKWLGERGVMVERSVYTTDWIAPNAKYPVSGLDKPEIERLAAPYLSHSVGGEGQQTIAHTVHYAEKGFDGVLHLMPFTCMPETIAKTLLPTVSKDMNIPVLTLVVDEQTGQAGVMTRLEAMLDLMWARKAAKLGSTDWLPIEASV